MQSNAMDQQIEYQNSFLLIFNLIQGMELLNSGNMGQHLKWTK